LKKSLGKPEDSFELSDARGRDAIGGASEARVPVMAFGDRGRDLR
jgi:hypothetical protein